MWLLRFFMRSKGSVSILLVIVLMPSLLLAGLLVDLANRNMSKAIVEEAGELAASSILSRYDSVLEDVYGIFAISQDYDDLQANVQKYMEDTISAAGFLSYSGDTEFQSRLMQALQSSVSSFLGSSAENVSTGLIRADISGLTAEGVSSSSLEQSAILENQIVEFMKYRGPAEVGMDLIGILKAFNGVNAQSKVADAKTKVDEKIADLGDTTAKLYHALVQLDELIEKVKETEPDENQWASIHSWLREASNETVLHIIDTLDTSDKRFQFRVMTNARFSKFKGGETIDVDNMEQVEKDLEKKMKY